MRRFVDQLLGDIVEELEFLIAESTELSLEEFLSDPAKTLAFVRSIEIIGEATNKIPNETRAEGEEVPWRLMAGMRDRPIHDYAGVDYEMVWDVAVTEAV
ncbi:MAG: HepT-like ribonuclease domain-containing protein [Verrucomicrobiota bacterium]